MDNNKYDLAKILKFELKQRNNPTDLKAVNIGVVEQLSPLIVSISENKILLEENEELIISEWFRFRCNINKTGKLSSGVPSDLDTSKAECDSASGVSEVHSFGGSPCQIAPIYPQNCYIITCINQIKFQFFAFTNSFCYDVFF